MAILVIAATSQPVYRHYLASYWTDLIRHCDAVMPNLDVYLLLEHGSDRRPYRHLAGHVIEDPDPDVARRAPAHLSRSGVPGILSKTIHAFDALAGEYDVFFRTNLSSIVRATALDRFVQDRAEIGYSGAWVWTDALRDDLVANDRVGPGRNVESLSELDTYPGNTFISGAGFFLNATDAHHLVAHREELRYDLPDDVAIGLMLDRHEMLPGFSGLITPDVPIAEALERIERTTAPHIRLQHFPVERARALWRYLADSDAWR